MEAERKLTPELKQQIADAELRSVEAGEAALKAHNDLAALKVRASPIQRGDLAEAQHGPSWRVYRIAKVVPQYGDRYHYYGYQRRADGTLSPNRTMIGGYGKAVRFVEDDGATPLPESDVEGS